MYEVHHRDLFGYLFDQYCENTDRPGTIADFLSFCRNTLRSYPPCEVMYVANGMGVKLTNGVRLAFTQDQLGTPVMRDESVVVMGSNMSAGMPYFPPAHDVPVFGGLDSKKPNPYAVPIALPEPEPEPPEFEDTPVLPELPVDLPVEQPNKRHKRHKPH